MINTPTDIGLPAKFKEWRPLQDVAIGQVLDSDKRFVALVCATGFGKSLIYTAAALMIPGRTVILTSTKALQKQLMGDFEEVGMTSIQGKGNYVCRLNTALNCDSGICNLGVKCSMRTEGGCFYFDQLRRAKESKIVVTNYAYWLSQNEYSDGIGKFDMLVLDEAHAAPDHVIDHLGVRFHPAEYRELKITESIGRRRQHTDWRKWALDRLDHVDAKIDNAKVQGKIKDYAKYSRMKTRLERVLGIDHTWLWEVTDGGTEITPIWPDKHTESALFLGINRVVLTSATLVKKTLSMLGISDSQYIEYPHFFPVENRRLIHVSTVKVNYRNGPAEEKLITSRIDQIIGSRLETKGIIHTVSYARRDMVLKASKYADYMVTHTTATVENVVKLFKLAKPPCILVSPSMVTGFDFPGDECRWQIIIKLPYPNINGRIIHKRMESDDQFAAYLAMQQLIQACGRGVRSMDDHCESFILDNNIEWFLPRYTDLAVDWFSEAVEKRNQI